MRRRLAALLLALASAAPGAAQQVVTSPGPEAVSVTVYRDPGRSIDRMMTLEWLGGYALVSETRTVTLPAGESVIRFEGVAGSILPASAVVTGLPRGLSEKNHDARLLSPGALVDASLGRQVHIRRINGATGQVVETEAVIRSGPDGIVLQTREGYEALRCSGLPETLIYPEAPADLADRPTLAVRTSADSPVTATVRLSYLAGQFDWQASYVAHLAPDGRTLDLFAWLTLANGNGESFASAQTQAVAGNINREESNREEVRPVAPGIDLQCWPVGTTSDVASGQWPPGAPLEADDMIGDAIIVTGSRIRRTALESSSPITAMSAEQEELGDLKLYRIPEPVTVAANAQKQVALLSKARVPVERIFGAARNAADEAEEPTPLPFLLRMKNVEKSGLGLPLPSGGIAVFETASGRPMLIGETPIADAAVGQEVEINVGEATDVHFTLRRVPFRSGRTKRNGVSDADGDGEDDRQRYEIALTSARPAAAAVEFLLWTGDERRLVAPTRRLGRKNGAHFWRARLPANGRIRLGYTVERIPDPPARQRSAETDD